MFGNIFQQLRKTARIKGFQKSERFYHCESLQNLEKELTKKYDDLLQLKKEFYMTKSRTTWLSEGNANTTFFHTSTFTKGGKIKSSPLLIRLKKCMKPGRISWNIP